MSRENTNNRARQAQAQAREARRLKRLEKEVALKRARAEEDRFLKAQKLWTDSLKLKQKLVERETGEWWRYHIEEDGTLLSKKIKELWPEEALAQRRGEPSPRFGVKPTRESLGLNKV